MKKTITLTHEQAVTLTSFLLMTTNYRKGERETWEKLATEREPDGTPSFKHAADNARFWAEMEQEIETIRKIIDGAPLLDD